MTVSLSIFAIASSNTETYRKKKINKITWHLLLILNIFFSTYYFPGWLRRAHGDPACRQEMAPGRNHILGNRMCQTKPTWRLHENIRVSRLDKSNSTILNLKVAGSRFSQLDFCSFEFKTQALIVTVTYLCIKVDNFFMFK